MASTATNTTYDVSSKVALFRTIVFSMTNTTAVLTDLVLVVAKGTI